MQKRLKKIFGIGAQFVEVQIMKNLHAIRGNSMKMKKKSKLEFINTWTQPRRKKGKVYSRVITLA